MTEKTTIVTEKPDAAETTEAIVDAAIERTEAETAATVAIIEANTEARTEIIAAEAAAQITIGEAEWQKERTEMQARISALTLELETLRNSQPIPPALSEPPVVIVAESSSIPQPMELKPTEVPAETPTEALDESAEQELPAKQTRQVRRRFL